MWAVAVGGGEKQLWHEPTNTFAHIHEVVFVNKKNVKKKQAISKTSLPCDVCIPWHLNEGELVHQNTASSRGACSALRFITTSTYTDTPKPRVWLNINSSVETSAVVSWAAFVWMFLSVLACVFLCVFVASFGRIGSLSLALSFSPGSSLVCVRILMSDI